MRRAWQGMGPAGHRGRDGPLSQVAQFDSVGLRYGTGAEVLRDLDFRLQQGGFYFLTGPSGAGKTSLLKLLYLAQRPTRGRIALFGLCMLLFLGGFALMALGATEESIALFTGGIASSGLAFFIGLNRSGR